MSGVVDWGRKLFAGEPATTVGTTVDVAASTFHPDVSVLAGAPVAVQPGAGVRVPKGQHLVAVPLRLSNEGLLRWDLPVTARTTVIDTLGVEVKVAKAITSVKAHQLLPAQVKLAPGSSVTGYTVFAVPNGRSIRSVTLALGQSPDDAVTWQAAP
jgi:hypothetical protein